MLAIFCGGKNKRNSNKTQNILQQLFLTATFDSWRNPEDPDPIQNPHWVIEIRRDLHKAQYFPHLNNYLHSPVKNNIFTLKLKKKMSLLWGSIVFVENLIIVKKNNFKSPRSNFLKKFYFIKIVLPMSCLTNFLCLSFLMINPFKIKTLKSKRFDILSLQLKLLFYINTY